MNAPTLFAFLLAVFLSFMIGKYLFPYIGWWGVLPAVVLGFGFVTLLIALLRGDFKRQPPSKRPDA